MGEKIRMEGGGRKEGEREEVKICFNIDNEIMTKNELELPLTQWLPMSTLKIGL